MYLLKVDIYDRISYFQHIFRYHACFLMSCSSESFCPKFPRKCPKVFCPKLFSETFCDKQFNSIKKSKQWVAAVVVFSAINATMQ